MRILHLLPHLDDAGDGIVNSTVDLACEQSVLGHEVRVASAGGAFEHLLADHGVEHVPLAVTRRLSRLWPLRKEIHSMLGALAPDITHAHTLTTAVSLRAGRLVGRPPLVTTVHTEFYRSTPLMAVGDRVIAPSQAVARSIRRRGIPRRKIRVVLNGTLGGPRSVAREEPGPAPLVHPAVVSVASMYRRKGIDDLISAFARLPALDPAPHLYLVGEGPDRAEFEDLARRIAEPGRVHFTGYERYPNRYLASADLFVLASHRDPCPLVVAEARDAGCAILASDADGIPELLEQGRAGRLFPAGDRDALTRGIKKFLTDEDYRCSWQREAQKNVEWLRTDRVARETLAVYEELLR